MMLPVMAEDVGADEVPERREPSWVGAAATTLGLGAFAVAQPLFDLLASHVPFLVAHQLDATDLTILASKVSRTAAPSGSEEPSAFSG